MKDDTNSSAISTAKSILDLASFIAMFLAGIMSSEKLKFWQEHKNEMKTKLRKALAEVFANIADEFADIRRDWEAFCKKRYGWTVDFSEVPIPQKPEGAWRLIIVAKGLTCDKVYDAWAFAKWKYVNSSIDEAVPKNIRTAKNEQYAVWVRDSVEPDAEFLGKSTNQVDPEMKIGMTLLERMLLEDKYFDETGKHLDAIGATLCGGSRNADGDVPSVRLDGGG